MSKNISGVVKYLTVEPAFLLYTAVFVILELTGVNLLIQKKCRFNVTSEPDLSTPCQDEKQGIIFAAETMAYIRFLMFSLTLLYTAFSMCWSDESDRRRRPLIFLPIIGLMMMSVSGCLHSYFWHWDAHKSALSYLFFEVISGGMPLIMVASQAYICDVTDIGSRTMRMGLFTAARTVGDLIGFGSSGFVLHRFGFFRTYLLCFVLSLITLLLAVIFVRDASVQVKKKRHFWHAFNLMRIVDSFKIVFKKNIPGKRIIIVALSCIYILMFFCTQGENSVQYMFLRHKFHWDERDYSIYVVYRYIGVILGSIFASIVLSKCMNLHDGVIGIISGFWDAIAAFGYLFASLNWQLYVVPLFDVFHGTAFSVSVSFFSKFYAADEIGRLNSVLCILSLVIPTCYPTYITIFRKTLDSVPSAYFVLSIAINVIVVLLYLLCYKLDKKSDKLVSAKKEEKPMLT
ncbi:probable peptidoglycan muropeptide transporter SLC46 [Planococcus citri]|uniref:probable peptidoglycan muropeptide transporter SLC46 n=1 Tax=Planococcus citri TaxID=170843 RepID=UPI0031F80B97